MDPSEITSAVDGMMSAFEGFKKSQNERLDGLEMEMIRQGRPLVGGSDRKAAGGDLSAERKALGMFVKVGDERELKGMETGVGPEGGYIVLSAISDSMTRRLWDSSPIRRLARIQTMTTGDAWVEPIDRDESSAEWVSETASRPALDTPQLGLLTIALDEIYSNQVVTQKLLDLSYVDIGAWLENKISDKFARTESAAFLTGNGVGQPRGLLDYPIVSTADATRPADQLQYIPGGGASTVTADGLRSLYWGLRAPYRSNATWLMSSATAATVDKLKDGAGVYLWRPSTSVGEPPTLLGRPVEIDENMPAITNDTHPIAFGDFQRGYIIVERIGLKMLRDPYTSKPNVVFYAYRRVGGGLADCDAIRVLKVATS